MADEDIKIKITAEDKASGVFNNVSKSMGGLTDAAHKAANAIGVGLVAGFGAATAFGIQSIKSFIEAEKQMAVANVALENTVKSLSDDAFQKLEDQVGGGSITAMEGLKKVMEETGQAAIKLGFDDEDASVAFAKLFQVSQDVTQAQSDLALAMDLAAFSGRGLEESAAAITKVHAGATRVLKEFGIEVKDGTTDLEALALIQGKAGGAAEAMAATTGKQLEILGIRWENLKETVGGALAEAITPFITQLSDWAAKPETQQKLQEIVDKLVAFVQQMIPIIQNIMPAFISIIKFASQTLGVFFDWWGQIWFAIGTASVKLEEFIGKIKSMIEWVTQAIEKIQRLAAELAKGALNQVGNFGKTLTAPIDALLGRRASGGPVSAGGAYLVGERGPELFVPGASGSIVPNAGGTATIINNYITGNSIINEDIVDRISTILTDKLKMQLRI